MAEINLNPHEILAIRGCIRDRLLRLEEKVKEFSPYEEQYKCLDYEIREFKKLSCKFPMSLVMG